MNKIVHMYGNKLNTIVMDSSKLIPISTSRVALKSSLCWYVHAFSKKKFQLLTKVFNICIVFFSITLIEIILWCPLRLTFYVCSSISFRFIKTYWLKWKKEFQDVKACNALAVVLCLKLSIVGCFYFIYCRIQ